MKARLLPVGVVGRMRKLPWTRTRRR